jgi:hypothetical protein
LRIHAVLSSDGTVHELGKRVRKAMPKVSFRKVNGVIQMIEVDEILDELKRLGWDCIFPATVKKPVTMDAESKFTNVSEKKLGKVAGL